MPPTLPSAPLSLDHLGPPLPRDVSPLAYAALLRVLRDQPFDTIGNVLRQLLAWPLPATVEQDQAQGAAARPRDFEIRFTPLHALATNPAWKNADHAQVLKGWDLVDRLVLNGAVLDAERTAERTPLTDAAEHGHLGMVQRLIAHGATLAHRDNDRMSALHLAISRAHLPVIDALLAAGAPVNEVNDYPPLHAAATSDLPEVEAVIDRLIAAGAEVNARTGSGITPLFQAVQTCRSPTVVRALVRHGADPDLLTDSGTSARILAQKDVSGFPMEQRVRCQAVYTALTGSLVEREERILRNAIADQASTTGAAVPATPRRRM